MAKRKASIALDDADQSDNGLDDINATSVLNINNGGDTSNLNDNDNVNNNRPGEDQLLPQNGSSSGILSGRAVKCQPSNNQNDNSNSSIIGNGNNNISQQHHNKGKKERADNWSSAEIHVLHRGIESRGEIFYGPPSQATKKNRELAWEAITKEVNTVSTTPRTLSQVMKKFKNEKCRAKRKFVDSDKDSHNSNQLVGESNNNGNLSNGNNNSTNSNSTASAANDLTSNLRAQQQTTNHNAASSNQQQQLQQHQAHLMATSASAGGSGETMATPQATSINVVKLAPQNVAKTMIDLPGHVQHTIQMPNDDMVLIVPPDMDGLLSGVNIVSDGTGHHHFQKCSSNTLGSHQQSHPGQHGMHSLNTNQGLMNGTMSNGMMARTIPAGSMCSLVYSTGNEVCGPEHHLSAGQSSIAPNHIAVNAQNLVHHRGPNLDQGPQHHQLHHASQATHQQHQQQHPQSQQHTQQQPPPPHQHHHHQQQQHVQASLPQSQTIHHQHLAQNQLGSSSSSTSTAINASNTSGVAVESQLKNLLFNLLLKDGQHASMPNSINPNQDYSKQRNDMLAIIASSLAKIEGHLSKISKVAGALFNSNTSLADSVASQLAGQTQQMIEASASVATATNASSDTGSGGLTIESDNNNNSFNISNQGPGPNMTTNQRNND